MIDGKKLGNFDIWKETCGKVKFLIKALLAALNNVLDQCNQLQPAASII